MRNKRPMQNNGGYNQHRKPRYQGGGMNNGGGDNRGGGHRPRKNYSAMREKYLSQARDALASGDRVLSENYLQHADHCYRMMMEENATRPRPQVSDQQGQEVQQHMPQQQEEIPMDNSSALPAFLTGGFQQPAQQQQAEPPVVQDWEERDGQ